jgi:membrane protein implicated in regulation of membrane protease activity
MTWIHDIAEFVRALTGMGKMEFYTLMFILLTVTLAWVYRHAYEWWTRRKIAKELSNSEIIKVCIVSATVITAIIFWK